MMNLAATVLPAPLSPLPRTNQSGLRGHVTGSRPITAHHSPDDDALVLVVYRHVAVHVVRQRVDVRRVLIGCLQLDIAVLQNILSNPIVYLSKAF